MSQQNPNCKIHIIWDMDFFLVNIFTDMLPAKVQKHKMKIRQNSIYYHRIVQKAFYKISLKKTVKSSCPSAARTWQAASFFYGTFCQAAKSFISVMGKPKSGNTEREPYRLSCLIKKIIYPNFPSTVHFSNTSHP